MDRETAELEQTLSELVDLVLEVKQASWKVPPAEKLHRYLDGMLESYAEWSGRLAELVTSQGGDLTADLASPIARHPADLFPHDVDDAEVVRVLDGALEAEAGRVRDHLAGCDPEAAAVCALLEEVAAGLDRQRAELAELAG